MLLRSYETAVILSASLSETELEQEVSRIVDLIGKAHGVHTGTQQWGRRLLTFPLKKQTEGVYYFIRWNGTEEVSAAIDWNLKIDENCLRHLNLRLDDSRVTAGEDRIQDEAAMPEEPAFTDEFDSEDESEQDAEE